MIDLVTTNDWLRLLVVLAILSLCAWAFFWTPSERSKPVPNGPANEPYKVYTTEFDREINGAELVAALPLLSLDAERGNLSKDRTEWDEQIAAATRELAKLEKRAAEPFFAIDRALDTAVLILVDQSGSMKGHPMARIAAGVRKVAGEWTRQGCAIEIVGFSTAGWRGGFAKLKWERDGRPKRPGRLCSTLYAIYKPFDSGFDQAAWEAMLNPDVLRENVDGEALLWAERRLAERPETRRAIIVVSDGAPVDDATLLENGDEYLARHLRRVVSGLQLDASVGLGAIGIDHRVDEIYRHSATLGPEDDFPEIADRVLRKVTAARGKRYDGVGA